MLDSSAIIYNYLPDTFVQSNIETGVVGVEHPELIDVKEPTYLARVSFQTVTDTSQTFF